MQIQLSTIVLFVTICGLVLSGVLDNLASILLVLPAAVTWLAMLEARGSSRVVGVLSVLGWLLAAAIIAAAY